MCVPRSRIRILSRICKCDAMNRLCIIAIFARLTPLPTPADAGPGGMGVFGWGIGKEITVLAVPFSFGKLSLQGS